MKRERFQHWKRSLCVELPACADNICLAHCIYFGDPAGLERTIAEERAGALSDEE